MCLSIKNIMILSKSPLLKYSLNTIQLVKLNSKFTNVKEFIKHVINNILIYSEFMNFGAPWIFPGTSANFSHNLRSCTHKCTLVVMYPSVLQLEKTSSGRYHTKINNTRLVIDSDKIDQIGSHLRKLIFSQLLFTKTLKLSHLYFCYKLYFFYKFIFPYKAIFLYKSISSQSLILKTLESSHFNFYHFSCLKKIKPFKISTVIKIFLYNRTHFNNFLTNNLLKILKLFLGISYNLSTLQFLFSMKKFPATVKMRHLKLII